jgi:hypothetical protein
MHKQHPQTAYRKYAVSIGTIFENCDKKHGQRHLPVSAPSREKASLDADKNFPLKPSKGATMLCR